MSKTKRNISGEALDEIFLRHSLGKIAKVTPLKGGQFNSVLKISMQSGENYVIKIAPSKETDVLTYENNLIKSEVYFYEKFADLNNVCFPKIYGHDYSPESEYQYLIMEYIEGQMLTEAKLSGEEYSQVMLELGKAMAEIHNLPCEEDFGYIQNGLYKTWEEAYLSMTENVIKNAERKNAKIPYLGEIRSIIEENRNILREVKNTSFVHFDLWAGNIILRDKRLYALIDCERAMIGDTVGDFISLDYTAAFDLEENKHLIEGYNSAANEPLSFDSNEMKRLYLMKIYLGLIVYTEQYYRHGRLSPEFYAGRKFGKKVLHNAIENIKRIED